MRFSVYRYDPDRDKQGLNPLQLDSRAPKIPLKEYLYNENRYRILQQSNPEAAAKLLDQAQTVVDEHWQDYERMAQPNDK